MECHALILHYLLIDFVRKNFELLKACVCITVGATHMHTDTHSPTIIRSPTGGQQRIRSYLQPNVEGLNSFPIYNPFFTLSLLGRTIFFPFTHLLLTRCILMMHKTWFMLLGTNVIAVYRNTDVGSSLLQVCFMFPAGLWFTKSYNRRKASHLVEINNHKRSMADWCNNLWANTDISFFQMGYNIRAKQLMLL